MLSQLVSLPVLAVFVGILYFVSHVVYNLFFHPLRKYPGPVTHRITGIVIAYHQLRGNVVHHIQDLHRRYGAIVRVRPNELSFIDECAWDDIYGHRTAAGTGNLPKDVRNRPEENNTQTILIANDADHKRFRRIQAPMFSEKAISAQEPCITEFVELLVARLREKANSPSNVVDMMLWYTYTAFDVLGELAFREPFDCLKRGELDSWVKVTLHMLKDISYWDALQEFPWPLNKLLYLMIPREIRNARNQRTILANRKVRNRVERGSTQEKTDFMSQILKHNDEKGMTAAEIDINARILIIAGSETTATLLSGLTYLLLINREHLEKLTKLIRTTFASPKDITGLKLYKLDYLSAIINESFRFYSPVPGTLPRVATKGGSVICGEVVPEYTRVGVASLAANKSPRNWTDPDKFVPERWYKDDRCPEQYRTDRRKVMQPFSYGPRNCIGKNMAATEMRIIIAHILWNFDMELEPETLGWMDQKIYTLWEKKPLNVRIYHRED